MSDQEPTRRRRLIEATAAIVLGAAAAHFCHYLPEPWAVPCRVVAKILSLLIGG